MFKLLLWVMLIALQGQCIAEFTPTKFKISAPPAKRIELKPQFFPELNSKRVQLNYGPFSVEPMSKYDGMKQFVLGQITLPCTNCTITYMAASLEHPDGSEANANSSLWLHHVVLINYQVPDTVCKLHYYGEGQRFFASGNERVPADISNSGQLPVGYYLKQDAIGVMIVELMNQAMYTQQAMPTITFEYIEGFPSDFYHANPMWLDITGCGQSDKMPPKNESLFTYSSPPWAVDFSGPIVGMGGHLHDGGTHLEIYKNDKEVCNSVALYGQSPWYYDKPGTSMVMPMIPNFSPMKHISTMTTCMAPSTMLNPGDVLNITAFYNFTEYQPMLELNSKPSPIMGIALVYAAQNMTWDKMTSYVGSKVAPLEKTPIPTEVASMEMGAMDTNGQADMGQMLMTCVPSRDSPGTITTAGINMSVRVTAMAYLMALLNDTCLQAWSKPYARYLWYGIVVVIGLFTLKRIGRSTRLNSKKRRCASNKHTGTRSSGGIAKISGLFRLASYPQVTPTGMPRVLKVPNIGNIFMVTAYFGFLLALEFISASTGDNQTYQFRGVRAGWLSVAQVPLIVLLANKRNLIELFTGVSYERLNVLHRWVARGLLLTTTMHFGFQSYGWAKAGVMQLEWNVDTCPPTGMGAYALVLWMNLSTLAPFRNFSYEFFVVQHIVTFMGLIIAIMLHLPTTALYSRTYIYVAIGLYLVSRLIQSAIYAYNNMTPSYANLSCVSHDVTKITINHRKISTWRPGSFVLISLPRFGIFQSHPATIASIPSSHGGQMVLYLRKHAGFTKKIGNDSAHAKEHVALIDGTYGGRQADLAAYETVILVAGSTGLTFTLPILLNIAARASSVRLPVQQLHFIWATKDQSFIDTIRPDILQALNALTAAGIKVSLHIHITGLFDPDSGADSEKSETTSNDSSTNLSAEAEKKGATTYIRAGSDDSIPRALAKQSLKTTVGRPDIKNLLSNAHANSTGEVGIAACGPISLSSDVRNIVSGLQMSSGNGVYLHIEGFCW